MPNTAQHPNTAKVAPGLHFSSEHFPVSSTFALFLELAAFGKSSIEPNLDWGDQVTEKMHGPETSLPEFRRIVRDAANRAFNTPVGRELTLKAYNLFGDLLVGNPQTLANLQTKRRYIFIVSAPRHGGSYLTKEMYRATGIDPAQVPNYLAHDGYPDCSPNWYTTRDGQDVPATRTTIQQTAEWIVMSDFFFRNQVRPLEGLPTFVKKATKMVYMGSFFRETFGPLAEWVVIVRHRAMLESGVREITADLRKVAHCC